MFLPDIPASNLAAAYWITTNARALSTDESSKSMLLLKSYFTHWLITESGDNITKSWK